MRSLKMSPFFWQWLLGWPRMSSRFDSTFFVHPFGTFWEDVNCKYVCFVVVDFFQALFFSFFAVASLTAIAIAAAERS